MLNPYEELHISKDATSEHVEKAYRIRAKKAHPITAVSNRRFERVR